MKKGNDLKICAKAKKAVAENKKIEDYLYMKRYKLRKKVEKLVRFAEANEICPLCANKISYSIISELFMRNVHYKCKKCKIIFIREPNVFDYDYSIKEYGK